MLEINEVKFAALPKGDDFVKQYGAAVRLLRQRFGKVLLLDFPKEKYKIVKGEKGRTVIEHPQGLLEPAERIYTAKLPDGRYVDWSVRYFRTERTTAKGVKKYTPSYIHFDGKMTINLLTDIDLAFYMLFVSPHCGRIEGEIGTFQNTRFTGFPHYVLFDERKDAEIEMQELSIVSDAEALIVSPRLGLPASKIRDLVIAYGLATPNKEIDEYVAKRLLHNYVMAKDRFGKYNQARLKEFIDEANIEGLIDVRVIVKKAIAYEVVAITGTGREKYWSITDERKNPVTNICRINSYMTAEKSLEKFLFGETDALKQLTELVNDHEAEKFASSEPPNKIVPENQEDSPDEVFAEDFMADKAPKRFKK